VGSSSRDRPRSRILLASGSPRRIRLLREVLPDFSVISLEVDERILPAETPSCYVARVAALKAREASCDPGLSDEIEWILAADTIVVLDEMILGKPRCQDEARRMLEVLQGRRHTVLTGMCLRERRSGEVRTEVVRTEVWMKSLRDDEIHEYVLSNEPYDKAGGYAIQGLAGRFIEKIEGSYSNVVGLPLERLGQILSELAIRDF